jgi:hypothetical protein
MNTDIRELNVTELDQVSGAGFLGWGSNLPSVGDLAVEWIGQIAKQSVGGKGGAGPAPA